MNSIFKLPHWRRCAIFLAIFVAACATTPNTVSNVSPDADFSQYSTFGFFDTLATDRQSYESMESNFLKVAVAQELDRRGLSYSESPDLVFNFYIHTKEKVRSRSVPTTGMYYDYRDPFDYDPFLSYPSYETRIEQYTHGTLNIDAVDMKTNKLVWEGMISGRITDSEIRNLEKTIDEAVAAIMANFPGSSP